MKIVSVIGARPEFIKEAPLVKELRKNHEEIIIHTGQHYDYEMSKVFFSDLKIPEPDYNLGIGSGPHGKQTAEMLAKIEDILLKEKPDLVIVSGDTNTTLAGALAASKLNLKLAHIESGMRSFDKSMPEEINRIVADHVSDALFCSTKTAVQNLKREGIAKNVFNVGDVMIDAIKENIGIAEKKSNILKKLKLKSKSYMVATVHRAGNTDDKKNMSAIISAFTESREKIIFPVHPRAEKYIHLYELDKKLKKTNVIVTKPMGYMDMLVLEKNSSKILTDSGGMQKEAYFFKVPCVTLRDTTEWAETVSDGWNLLTGADKSKILNAIKNFSPKGKQHEDYGNGYASKNIARIIDKI
ncbi:UDP-N-acetylglucosamine 2-epimerase (non-hydrolyzing) [Candidatus Woesearchaeota archaeon]|nr:UDP-N-acetylglucosamine 2-epimerase (non-hydrolyzing) [Candidatus Woesearchaeota archaeon]